MQITWLTTVCGRCSYSILRVYKPTDNWGGSHLVYGCIWLMVIPSCFGNHCRIDDHAPILAGKITHATWPSAKGALRWPWGGHTHGPSSCWFMSGLVGFGASWWNPEFSRAESPLLVPLLKDSKILLKSDLNAETTSAFANVSLLMSSKFRWFGIQTYCVETQLNPTRTTRISCGELRYWPITNPKVEHSFLALDADSGILQ